jgi:site-specific recombinase XerD
MENPPRGALVDHARSILRRKHYSLRTERTYLLWMERFMAFHRHRNPKDLGPREIEAFLTHLAIQEQVAAATQNQALSAILFLYRSVLGLPLETPFNAARARTTRRIPTVLSRDETRLVLGYLTGEHQLMAQLLYGSGLRLTLALRWRAAPVHVWSASACGSRTSTSTTIRSWSANRKETTNASRSFPPVSSTPYRTISNASTAAF